MRHLNWPFVFRGALLALGFVALIAGGMLGVAFWLADDLPYGPTPPPITPAAPPGVLPAGPVGLAQWVDIEGQGVQPAASGFLLALPDGSTLGVTTAHSVTFGVADRLVVGMTLRANGEPPRDAVFSTLHGPPGHHDLMTRNFGTDVVLMRPDALPDDFVALTPDARGRPEPGERVLLFPGNAGQSIGLSGIVQRLDANAVWIAMDRAFDPGGMSGSPVVSAHTGRLLGMAVVAGERDGQLIIGLNPVDAIVARAAAARAFPAMRDAQP